jgi:hypothetical protein
MYESLACDESVLLFLNERHAPDVIIENGWSLGPHHSHAVIGYLAETERGEVFLTAYHRETYPEAWHEGDDGVIGSGSLLPKELGDFKRMRAEHANRAMHNGTAA